MDTQYSHLYKLIEKQNLYFENGDIKNLRKINIIFAKYYGLTNTNATNNNAIHDANDIHNNFMIRECNNCNAQNIAYCLICHNNLNVMRNECAIVKKNIEFIQLINDKLSQKINCIVKNAYSSDKYQYAKNNAQYNTNKDHNIALQNKNTELENTIIELQCNIDNTNTLIEDINNNYCKLNRIMNESQIYMKNNSDIFNAKNTEIIKKYVAFIKPKLSSILNVFNLRYSKKKFGIRIINVYLFDNAINKPFHKSFHNNLNAMHSVYTKTALGYVVKLIIAMNNILCLYSEYNIVYDGMDSKLDNHYAYTTIGIDSLKILLININVEIYNIFSSLCNEQLIRYYMELKKYDSLLNISDCLCFLRYNLMTIKNIIL